MDFDRDFIESLNRRIIEAFRANDGEVSSVVGPMKVLLLHHTGARTGAPRLSPLAYLADGDRFAVFASKGGEPTHPDWYHNLVAHPRVTVEIGTEKFEAVARVTEGEERERLWSKQKADQPIYAQYEAKTTRTIPVVVLERSA